MVNIIVEIVKESLLICHCGTVSKEIIMDPVSELERKIEEKRRNIKIQEEDAGEMLKIITECKQSMQMEPAGFLTAWNQDLNRRKTELMEDVDATWERVQEYLQRKDAVRRWRKAEQS